MTRNLWSLAIVGVMISALSGAGVVAVFDDAASTGTNSVTSGEQPHLGLLIAQAELNEVGDTLECAEGQYGQDLQLGVIEMSEIQPGDERDAYVCIKNTSNVQHDLYLTAADLVDEEVTCGADEAGYDSTCPGEGELSSVLWVYYLSWDDCQVTVTPIQDVGLLADIAAESYLTLATVAAGEVTCAQLRVWYHPDATDYQRQAAQTDSVTWRFVFSTTPPAGGGGAGTGTE